MHIAQINVSEIKVRQVMGKGSVGTIKRSIDFFNTIFKGVSSTARNGNGDNEYHQKPFHGLHTTNRTAALSGPPISVILRP